MDKYHQSIEDYLKLERDPHFKQECTQALESNNVDLIERRFAKRIAFGTAGLRGLMGFGISCMNSATVLQASQGLCRYYQQLEGIDACRRKCVVIGYDGRYNSRYFAHLTGAVFISQGIKVVMTDRVTATPITPFLVVQYQALCGIQVTASHNPKADNGYKVYGSNGAQIVPPMDGIVHELILAEKDEWPGVCDVMEEYPKCCLRLESDRVKQHVVDPFAEDDHWENYKHTLKNDLALSPLCNAKLKVVYTAMHGVGYKYIDDFLVKDLGYPKSKFTPVLAQRDPDPEFRTVLFPNPEEKGALDLAKATADEIGAGMIIANDPDADRFAAGEKLADGSWYMFTGDELGTLFGMIAYEKAKKKFPELPQEKFVFICSAVSSRFLSVLAKAEGCQFIETATGFKWMMNKALQMREAGFLPIFCYEEALGYGLSLSVPDKDGVSAAAVWLEKANELAERNMSMHDWLVQIGQTYGYFATQNSYYICKEPELMAEIFAAFRNRGQYPSKIGKYNISRIRDVSQNYDSSTPDLKSTFPPSSSDMLTIYFTNGAHITWRGSGTEPKLKYYSEMRHPESKMQAKEQLAEVVDAVCECLIGNRPLTPA